MSTTVMTILVPVEYRSQVPQGYLNHLLLKMRDQ